jgi:hypothetical protein
MPAYWVARSRIIDPVEYKKYKIPLSPPSTAIAHSDHIFLISLDFLCSSCHIFRRH